jgi:CRP-like cAMP-binding protein
MTDRDSVVTALAGGWFGSGLSPHARSQLAYCATLRPYPAGAVILREGDETDPFGVVTAGRVALRLLVPERGEATIMTVEPGDVVGWSALVPPRRSTSTAVALEPTTLLAFDVGELRRALLDDAELAATVYPRLLEAVARRLGATRHQLLDLYAQQAEPVPW